MNEIEYEPTLTDTRLMEIIALAAKRAEIVERLKDAVLAGDRELAFTIAAELTGVELS